MLSVWHESIDIYLGRNLIIVKIGQLDARAIDIPATLSAHMVMDRLDSTVSDLIGKNRNKSIFRRRLRVKLGAALCPAVSFHLPTGVIQWEEKMKIAHATAISVMGQDVEIICELAKGSVNVAAAISLGEISELKRWAKDTGLIITSCEPLWAAVSRADAVIKKSVSGFILQEPDAISVLAENVDGRWVASTLTHTEDSIIGSIEYSRWMVGLNAQEDQMLKILFSSEIKSTSPYRRGCWLGHCEIS